MRWGGDGVLFGRWAYPEGRAYRDRRGARCRAGAEGGGPVLEPGYWDFAEQPSPGPLTGQGQPLQAEGGRVTFAVPWPYAETEPKRRSRIQPATPAPGFERVNPAVWWWGGLRARP